MWSRKSTQITSKSPDATPDPVKGTFHRDGLNIHLAKAHPRSQSRNLFNALFAQSSCKRLIDTSNLIEADWGHVRIEFGGICVAKKFPLRVAVKNAHGCDGSDGEKDHGRNRNRRPSDER